MLRTTFMAVDGQPFRILAADPVVRASLTDLSAAPADVREAALHRLAAAATRRPFDLARGPCWRTLLVRLDERDHALIVAKHQIVSDGWSTQVFFRELAACYRSFAAATEPTLADLPMSYADFAEWQRASLEGDRLDALLAYWRRRLAGAPPTLDLATDYARGVAQPSDDGRQSLTLSGALSGALRALSRDEGVTPFMTLLAAFGVLLHRYTGQDDVLVGSPSAGRSRPEIAALIGFFVNTLVLRLGALRRSDVSRAAPPRARDGGGRVRAPGPAVRAAGRAPPATARSLPHADLPGVLRHERVCLGSSRVRRPDARHHAAPRACRKVRPLAARHRRAHRAPPRPVVQRRSVRPRDRGRDARTLPHAARGDRVRSGPRRSLGLRGPSASSPAAPPPAAGPRRRRPSLVSRFEAEVRATSTCGRDRHRTRGVDATRR